MAFPLDEIRLGPAAFGRRRGTEGIIWHTTEAADASRASALSTVKWQLTNPGSYNFIIYDGGILLTVPFLEASGGVNPASPAWAPGRYPFLSQQLSLSAYADPNAFLLNVAFSGKTAVFRESIPANMIDTARRLVAWVAAQSWSSRTLVHSGHLHWQTNRSDPSTNVLNRITGDDMPILTRPVREKWAIPANTTFFTGGPELGQEKRFTIAVELWSNGETTDGAWRRIEYGSEDLWFRRADIKPVPGTRNPATGYGNPVLSGYSANDLEAAKSEGIAAGTKAGFADAKTKARVAVEAIRP